MVTFHDISGRRRAEAKLQESEERFRTLAETAATFIIANLAGGQAEFVGGSTCVSPPAGSDDEGQ